VSVCVCVCVCVCACVHGRTCVSKLGLEGTRALVSARQALGRQNARTPSCTASHHQPLPGPAASRWLLAAHGRPHLGFEGLKALLNIVVRVERLPHVVIPAGAPAGGAAQHRVCSVRLFYSAAQRAGQEWAPPRAICRSTIKPPARRHLRPPRRASLAPSNPPLPAHATPRRPADAPHAHLSVRHATSVGCSRPSL
jgi:hypothetical protein